MMGCLRVGHLQYWGRGKAYVGMQTCTEQSSAGLLLKHRLARPRTCQPWCPALTCTDSGRKHREGPCTRAVGTALCQPNARMSQVCGRSRFLKVPTKTLRCCSRWVNCCPRALPRGIIRRGYSDVRCVCRRLRGGSVKYFSVYVLWDELCSQPSQECAKCTHPSINLSRSVPPCEKTKHFIKSRACWSRSSILVLFQLISLHLHAIVLIGSNLHLLGTLHTRHDDHTGLQGD